MFRSAPNLPPPQRIVQDHNTIAAGFVLLRQKHAAELRADPEHRKQVCRSARAQQLFGLAAAGQIQADPPISAMPRMHSVLRFHSRKWFAETGMVGAMCASWRTDSCTT